MTAPDDETTPAGVDSAPEPNPAANPASTATADDEATPAGTGPAGTGPAGTGPAGTGPAGTGPAGAETDPAAGGTEAAPASDDEANLADELTPDEPEPGPKRLRSVMEWAGVIAGALIIAVLVRTFLVQAFSIPSESMESTLNRGDRLLVDKVSYRFGDVQRGDIVVFESPQGTLMSTDEPLIKRIIGLAGETVGLNEGVVTIDGARLTEPYLDPGVPTFPLGPIPGCVDGGSPTRCIVAEGHVFVLGDNRTSSRDSRFFGPVETDTIIGRAWLKYWPLGDIGTL